MAALVDHRSRRSARMAPSTMCARANSWATCAATSGNRFWVDHSRLRGRSMAFVGVRQRRGLGAWEHARMASSSSIRPARLTGSLRRIRFGAVAGWWQVQRGDLAKDLIIGVVVGVFLLLGGMVWDARLADRQNDLAKAIAKGQEDQARNLANQAEVLENTRFVRQIATSEGREMPKPFASINLRGAELGGLYLGCKKKPLTGLSGCADFRSANLQEANLTRAGFSGAGLSEADLRKANLTSADFSDALLRGADLGGVATARPAFFNGARMGRITLVQAGLDGADFTDASLSHAEADEAVLSSANFHHATLRLSRFKRADLRHANFRGANMTGVDLTSADLRGADFTRADLRNAVLTDVCFDRTTEWGSTSPPTSSTC
jgi:uncharacterized protein YjbI with pentapeptide repeats